MISNGDLDVTNSVQNNEELSTSENYTGKRDLKDYRKRTERTRRGKLSVWEYRLGNNDIPVGLYRDVSGRFRLLEKS